MTKSAEFRLSGVCHYCNEVVEERESKPGYPSVTSDLFCDKCDLLFRKLSNSIIRKQQRFRKGQQHRKSRITDPIKKKTRLNCPRKVLLKIFNGITLIYLTAKSLSDLNNDINIYSKNETFHSDIT